MPLETNLESLMIVVGVVGEESKKEAATQGGEKMPRHCARVEIAAETKKWGNTKLNDL
jgi:hypothetical protein